MAGRSGTRWSSPHAWGWTDVVQQPAARAEVVPTRVGVDTDEDVDVFWPKLRPVATATTRKLNPYDRASRATEIVSARGEGNSWAMIERRFGVSARQARRIVKNIGTASFTNNTVIDPIDIIEAAVLRCEAVINEQLAEIADTAEPAVAVKAISAQVRAAESEMALLQNAGLLPRRLSCIGQEIDARRAASRAVEVLNRYGVSAEARAELIAVLTTAWH